MKRRSGIYAILNIVNGKRYIGSSVDVRCRWSSHRSDLRRGKHDNRHLQRAWNKYGESAFQFMILEYVYPDFLLDIEQKYLKNNKHGYNLAKYADASGRGHKHSAVARAKMSAALKGKPKSAEHRAKLSILSRGNAFFKGHKHTAETRAKMSEAWKHRPPCSGATRAKLSAANMGRKLTDAHRANLSIARKTRKAQT